MKKICFIIGAAPFEAFPLPLSPSDTVIAADAGFLRLGDLGAQADVVIGDFDSLGALPQHKHIIPAPTEKDETDTLLAVREGLRLGHDTFVFIGGAGGRFDHTLANIQTLTFLAQSGVRGLLLGDRFAMTVIQDGAMALPAGKSGGVSVFCLGERAEGVTLRGLKYPLNNAELTYSFPVGVSNAFTGGKVEISVECGTLLVYWEDTPESAIEFFRQTEKS
ncbi:MAG TPA: thiamine diphosphokinase [Papillibacter sp.]|jgi:thiamine pyrophosphokinase|nr:thiamine diphosphokinase [Papillibacter sp.]